MIICFQFVIEKAVLGKIIVLFPKKKCVIVWMRCDVSFSLLVFYCCNVIIISESANLLPHVSAEIGPARPDIAGPASAAKPVLPSQFRSSGLEKRMRDAEK